MTDTPYYSLEKIKRLLRNSDTRIITRRDRQEAAALGYADDDEMVDRVSQVTLDEFKKKMPSEDMPGYWQDVYNSIEPDGTKIYIKLQIREESGVIISFKRK
ncbi:type II toxin-antitoxin system MqsR family toxin [Geotalea uraniireducens]|nr:type II toxin-antitoxin system MqsR family toxin [Geotalea uraniireducens]